MPLHTHPSTPEAKVPPRVTCWVPINITISSIPGAGRGLVAGGDVTAGDLIFSIKQPRLNMVDQSETALQNTCDNCLATKIHELATVPVENLRFMACTGCRIYHYCSKNCQRGAWTRHHKFECKALNGLREANMGYQVVSPNDHSRVGPPNMRALYLHREFRGMMRLLLLRNKDMIPDEEWVEYLQLQANREHKMADETFANSIKTLALLLKEFVDTPLDADDIVDLFCAMTNNNLTIYQPILFDQSFANVFDGTSIVSCGTSLEPFAALLNHSCEPNALWIFEGSELRIRARGAISAGEEITLSYGCAGDYQDRREVLLQQWKIDCGCALCQKGHLGLPEPLQTHIMRMCEREVSESKEELKEDQEALELVRKETSNSNILLRKLHMRIYRAAIVHSDEASALETALALFYNVEPAQVPPLSADERLTTLYNIISLLSQPTASSIFPSYRHYLAVYISLRSTVANESLKFFGADSHVAKVNKDGYERMLEEFREDNDGVEYEALVEERQRENRFVEGMQILLGWAGVEIRGLECLFRGL